MQKRNYLSIFLFLSIILSVLPINNTKANEKVELNQVKTSAVIELNTTLLINDLPSSSTNWTWAKDQGYCTGSGTENDPYVISGLFFNTSFIGDNCLAILNSRKYFIIRSCFFKGHTQYAGIKLRNTTNGRVNTNMMYPYTGALLWLLNASYNLAYNNNASAGAYYGILIDGQTGFSRVNKIYENTVHNNNDAGILLRGSGCLLNTVENNELFRNTYGIDINSLTKNNTIIKNKIENSTLIGIYAHTNSESNILYENCFINNTLHARDDGITNLWDNGNKGNYWDNYTGLDTNSDGIGDIPYNISGSTGSQDNFPLMTCPTPTNPPSLIPGYDIYFIGFAGISMIIGITLFLLKKKKLGNDI